jgi:hypothetical protein
MALIFTTLGEVEESTLVKTTGAHESDTEIVSWEEWRFEGEIVKRNVNMHLKHGIVTDAATASF